MSPLIPLLFAIGLLPIHGHTQSEYDEWLLKWEISFHADGPFVHEMLQARSDFLHRHPNGPTIPRPAVQQASSSSGRGSGGGGGMGSNVEQWRGLVAQFFPANQVDFALCVMRGESGGNPGADNPRSSAAGLWQFLRSTWDKMVPRDVTGGTYDSGAVYDPVASTRAAAWLWANAGWSQWNAAARC